MEEKNDPILVSSMDVNKLVERAYRLGFNDCLAVVENFDLDDRDEKARQALGKLIA